jgi:hypothetical protein
MAKYIVGLEKIDVGAIDPSGDYPNSGMSPLGDTYQGTAEFVMGDVTTTTHRVEEKDNPVIVNYVFGDTTVRFTNIDFTPSALVSVFGGESKNNGADWEAPAAFKPIEKAVGLYDKNGNYIKIPRMLLTARFNVQLGREGLGKVEVTGTVLDPGNDKPPLIIGQVTPPPSEA